MASHVAVVAADVVEEIHTLEKSHHPYVEVVVVLSFLAAVSEFPAAASVIVLTPV